MPSVERASPGARRTKFGLLASLQCGVITLARSDRQHRESRCPAATGRLEEKHQMGRRAVGVRRPERTCPLKKVRGQYEHVVRCGLRSSARHATPGEAARPRRGGRGTSARSAVCAFSRHGRRGTPRGARDAVRAAAGELTGRGHAVLRRVIFSCARERYRSSQRPLGRS